MRAESLYLELKIRIRSVLWKKRLELFTVPWKKPGLIHDEGPDKDGGYGPYIQSERCKSGLYMEYAKSADRKRARAYYCFCDKERLDS